MNQAENYGVAVKRAEAAGGGSVWRVRLVRHLGPEENGGRHNVFVNVFGLRGEELRGAANGNADVRIVWGWNGQRGDERAEPRRLDKPRGEPMTDIPLDRWQEVWCAVKGYGYSSDTVMGLHTNHPDEGEGNSLFHHSYLVEFQLVNEAAQPEPPVVPGLPPVTDGERAAIAGRLREMAARTAARAKETAGDAVDLQHLADAVLAMGEAKG